MEWHPSLFIEFSGASMCLSVCFQLILVSLSARLSLPLCVSVCLALSFFFFVRTHLNNINTDAHHLDRSLTDSSMFEVWSGRVSGQIA